MKKTKKKIRLSGVIFMLLTIYLLGMLLYYFITLPVKSINIKGNSLLTDSQIISESKIDYNNSIFKLSTNKIKNNLLKNPLVESVNISRNLKGTINIDIKESKILFYNILTKKLVLSNGKEMEDTGDYVGFPVLVNYVPINIYKTLIKSLAKIDDSNYKMISEIEYSVEKYNDKVVDEERFLLRMIDGNTIYVNLVNIEKLNKYQEIYAVLQDKGTLYLDSSSKNYVFKKYSEEKSEN